jgi:hypothetical protein
MCIGHKDLLQMQNFIVGKLDTYQERNEEHHRKLQEQIHELDKSKAVITGKVKLGVAAISFMISIGVAVGAQLL